MLHFSLGYRAAFLTLLSCYISHSVIVLHFSLCYCTAFLTLLSYCISHTVIVLHFSLCYRTAFLTVINAHVTSDKFFYEEIFEGLAVKLPNMGSRPNTSLIILTLYRQPNDSNTNQFLELLEEWLCQFDRKFNELVITGDMNLDLLEYESHTATSNYLVGRSL